jgi:hypothetical protein
MAKIKEIGKCLTEAAEIHSRATLSCKEAGNCNKEQ